MKHTILHKKNIKARNIQPVIDEPINIEKREDIDFKKCYGHIKRFYNKLYNKDNRIIIAPTGSGKSRLIKFLAINEATKSNRKIIICVPQNIISSSFIKSGDVYNIPKIKKLFWNIKSLCNETNTSQKLESFLAGKEIDQNICEKIRITTHQTLISLYKKGQLNLFNNVAIFIDEAHHISTDNNGQNILGSMIDELLKRKRNINFTLTTATFNRGDRAQILNENIINKYFTEEGKCFLPWDEYIGTLKHITDIKYSISFYKKDYIEEFCKDKPAKSILYLPITGSPYSVTGSPRGDAKRIINKLKSKKIVDLATPETQQSNERLLLEDKTEQYPADILLAVGKIKEGFNWLPTKTVAMVGNKTSATEIIQIMGRALRDYKGKGTVEVIHYFPYPFTEVKEEKIREKVNGFFNIIGLSMIFDNILFSSVLKLPYNKKKSGQKVRTKRIANVLSEVLDESNELAFYNDVIRQAIVALDKETSKAEQFEVFKGIVQEALVERDLDISAEKVAEYIWIKHTQKLLGLKGIDAVDLSYIEMIDGYSPLDFYETLFGNKFVQLRKTVRGKTKSLTDYLNLAEEKKLFLKRKTIPLTTDHKTWWECKKCGVDIYRTYYQISIYKHSCPNCSPVKSYVYDDYEALAKEKNLNFLDKEVPSSIAISCDWQCSLCGLCFSKPYTNIINSYNACPCSIKNYKKSIHDYKLLAAEKGLVFFGKSIPDKTVIKTKWKCEKCNKKIIRSFEVLKRTDGCSCARTSHKPLVHKDYLFLAKNRGLRFLDQNIPKTINIKCNWACIKCGDNFKSSFSIIKNSKKGCVNCHKNNIKTKVKKLYSEIEECFNITCLDAVPNSSKKKTNWKCNICSTIFNKSFVKIKHSGTLIPCPNRKNHPH